MLVMAEQTSAAFYAPGRELVRIFVNLAALLAHKEEAGLVFDFRLFVLIPRLFSPYWLHDASFF